MFSLVKTFVTLVVAATSVLSLTVNTPVGEVHSGQSLTITWESTPNDPTFSIELISPSFNSALALANNVEPAKDEITLTLPVVPV
ncbi:hypothetical protein FB451DRAFT_1483990 [Mycena latifolia]|nr:hypothetical protein FB451DRAFT_1483990 [Mycena latifolia]